MTSISIVSCVNDFEKYNSYVRASLQEEEKSGLVELIPIDNTSATLSVPEALNRGLQKASGKIVVFVSHDLNAVEKFCDRVILLEDGTIKDIDKPENILQRYMGIKRD